MENVDLNLPAAGYNVMKILGVANGQGNLKNYKVQWAPTWVNEIYLIGCEQLIQQFLDQEGRGKNINLETSDTKTATDTDNETLKDLNSSIQIPLKSDSVSGANSKADESEESNSLNLTTVSVDTNTDLLEHTNLKSSFEQVKEEQESAPSVLETDVLDGTEEVREDQANTDDADTQNSSEILPVLVQVKEEEKEEENQPCTTKICIVDEEVLDSSEVKEEEVTRLRDENHAVFSVPDGTPGNHSHQASTNSSCNGSPTLFHNQDQFTLNSGEYHFGQYLKEKDVDISLSTQAEWERVRKQILMYGDAAVYPSYPETNTPHADGKTKTPQTFRQHSRKRASNNTEGHSSAKQAYNASSASIDVDSIYDGTDSILPSSLQCTSYPSTGTSLTLITSHNGLASTSSFLHTSPRNFDTRTHTIHSPTLSLATGSRCLRRKQDSSLCSKRKHVVDLTESTEVSGIRGGGDGSLSPQLPDDITMGCESDGLVSMVMAGNSWMPRTPAPGSSRIQPSPPPPPLPCLLMRSGGSPLGVDIPVNSSENTSDPVPDITDENDPPDRIHQKLFGSPQGYNRVTRDRISQELRRMVVHQIKDILTVTPIISKEHERLIFERAQSRDNYLQMVARLLLYFKEKKAGLPAT